MADIQKKMDLAFLAAFYGGMLTKKQLEVLTLHCEEDLSFGEIAEEVGISRQAVHETLNRATARLEEMEKVLGVAKRFRRMEQGLEEAIQLMDKRDYSKARETLTALLSLDREEENGL